VRVGTGDAQTRDACPAVDAHARRAPQGLVRIALLPACYSAVPACTGPRCSSALFVSPAGLLRSTPHLGLKMIKAVRAVALAVMS